MGKGDWNGGGEEREMETDTEGLGGCEWVLWEEGASKLFGPEGTGSDVRGGEAGVGAGGAGAGAKGSNIAAETVMVANTL
mmetsp:Transcript_48521/g.94859  ORF Transcript_48521/g.94859 Transcript_48521/m.94859 type:complete len:80 (-) Transcript_48521:34-273(-)